MKVIHPEHPSFTAEEGLSVAVEVLISHACLALELRMAEDTYPRSEADDRISLIALRTKFAEDLQTLIRQAERPRTQ